MKLPRAVAIKRLGAALGAVVVGLAIGAVQYLPVREYVSWSPRAGGLADYRVATSYAWNPEELLNVYLPQFSGMLDNYWGRNGIHLHSDYVGVVVLVLAGAAFIGLRGDPRRKHIIFWSVRAPHLAAMVAGRLDALLPNPVRARSRNEILPRAGDDLLCRDACDRASGRRRGRAFSRAASFDADI